MAALWRDLRYAVRLFARERGFTATAVLTLALGLGSSTAVYGVVDGVLLRPLAYAPSDRVVQIVQVFGRRGTIGASTSLTSGIVIRDVFEAWRAAATTLDGFGIYGFRFVTLAGRPEPLRLSASSVSPQVFSMFGTAPIIGRVFSPSDAQPGHAAVALIGEALWRSRFGADPNIVGRPCTLDDRVVTVVGVLPARFTFPTPETAVWLPFVETPPPPTHPGERFIGAFTAVGRLRPGVTFAQAETEGTLIARRVQALLGDFGFTDEDPALIRLVPLRDRVVGAVRPALVMVLAAVMSVLLIAAANVAHLLLARGAARRREMAVRTALGASRLRLIRQSLTESLLLSLMAGALGLVMARWMLGVLPALAPATLPRLQDVGLDARVLGCALLLSLVTAVLFGILPALDASRADTTPALKPARSRARVMLIVTELAATLVLMTGASLLIESFVRVLRLDTGYESSNVATAQLSLPASRYPAARRAAFYEEWLTRAAALPSVETAGLAASLPLAPGSSNVGVRFQDGLPTSGSGRPMNAFLRVVSPDYFRVMGVRLLAGRVLTDADRSDAPGVVLVNQAFVRTYLSGTKVLGRVMRVALVDRLQIVGVVADIHHAAVTAAPVPEIYASFRQMPSAGPSMTLVVRSAGDPAALLAPIRALVTAMDRSLPLDNAMTMDERRSGALAETRFYTLLLAAFAGLALLIAVVGTYGVVAYLVSQRTQEIGIRIALGARSGDVMRLVMGQSVGVVTAALICGVAGAALVTRLLQRFLYEVRPTDVSSFASAAALLALAALAASYVPARRAARLDPVEALRQQ